MSLVPRPKEEDAGPENKAKGKMSLVFRINSRALFVVC